MFLDAHIKNGRNNNFNLLRFIAASLVVFSHSYSLTGFGAHEPLTLLFPQGLSFGSLAVNLFFILSGFLIVKSWHDRGDLVIFLYARIIRIYPALFLSVIFCAFFIGPVFTELHLIKLRLRYFFIFLFLLVLVFFFSKAAALYFMYIFLPYLLLFLAYVPGGYVREFNHFGDYSYGIYIYAFPIQQVISSFNYIDSPFIMFVISLFLTLLLAIPSWHFLEKRVLKAKMHRRYPHSVRNYFINNAFSKFNLVEK